MPLRIKEKPLEMSDSSSSTNCMPLKIKEEVLEVSDCSSSTNCVPLSLKDEVLKLSDNSSINYMPLKIKEELPELSDSSLLTNCMPLNIREEPLELSDNSSLTNNMSLNITDEMPDNVFLKIEIEENPESCDFLISPVTLSKNDHFCSKNIDVNIDDNIFKGKNAYEENISKTGDTSSCCSFSPTGATNVCEHDLVNNSDTLIDSESKNCLIRQTTNETATMPNINDAYNSSYSSSPLVMPLQNVSCSSDSVGSTSGVFLTNPECSTNAIKHIRDMVTKLKVVKRRDAWEKKYFDKQNIPSISKEKPNTLNDKNSAIQGVFLNNGKFWEVRDKKKNVIRGINKVRNESVDSTLNQNIPPILIGNCIINPNIPSISSKISIINPNTPCIIRDENSATESLPAQAGKVWEIRDEEHNVMCGINKVRNEIVDSTPNQNIPPILTDSFIINPNIPSISNEISIINPNTPCILRDENSATESLPVQAGKVREIRDEHNVMRGINKGNLEHNKNILSIYKDPEPMTNRNSPSITKDINPNIPRILSNENSAKKPSLVKIGLPGKIWEIRDKQRNVIRGINQETLKCFFPESSCTTSSQNKPKKNVHLLQNTKETEKPNKESQLRSYIVRNLAFSVENSGKTTNTTISDEHVESNSARNSRETITFKNGSQFQDKEKSNPRSLLRSSHAIFTEDVGKSAKERISAKNGNHFQDKEKSNPRSLSRSSHAIFTEDVGKSAKERISAKIQKSTTRGALVYDRVNSRPQISNLTKRLQPLYKYIKNNKCLLCGFESKAADTYAARRHLVCHLPGKKLKCDICDKYVSATGLPAHKANVHGKNKSKMPCKDCNLSFSTKGLLLSHRRRQHKPAQTYACLICNHEFKEAHSLKQHCRIHTGEKPFVCTVCGKTFRTRGMLNSHSLRHNEKKLYSCKLCDKSYNNKGLMTEHMNSHKETSNIKCKICGKTFNYKSNLAQHMFTHSDKRPHKCETCGLKFKFSHHLRSHLATHHV